MTGVRLMVDDEIHSLHVTTVPFEYQCINQAIYECQFRAPADLKLDTATERFLDWHRAEYQEATVKR